MCDSACRFVVVMAIENRLEQEALRRKERLAKLKEMVTSSSEQPLDETSNEDSTPKLPHFHNYTPTSEVLKENVLPRVESGNVREKVRDQLESAKTGLEVEEIDLTVLAPRKIDWDLKRDIAPKLEKLERRTQRAIVELIREKLASGRHDLLLSAVNADVKATEESHMSDED
ncbi:unnamed protein product [Soboliphyme baturini]|uniref:Coiled-coil domain-containing protein 12 n=1 Tax=Soboliphyme baturini TaxID=241478 RepID=A0A183IER9_9BILA|nr:unnamed protein product [Soboliphyme baturini]